MIKRDKFKYILKIYYFGGGEVLIFFFHGMPIHISLFRATQFEKGCTKRKMRLED
jgi:hypothetical protein